MERRLFLAEGDARRASSRRQRTPTVLLLASLNACIPLTAQRATAPPGPSPRSAAPTPPVSAQTHTATDPKELLAEALRATEAYRLHFRQTGDLTSMLLAVQGAREKAQTAYGQFLTRNDYAKAAQSLIAVAGIDRMLTVQSVGNMQLKQAPIEQEYSDALKLANQAHNTPMQYKALMGLTQANLNSKDYVAAADSVSKAIDLAVQSANKDDLCDAYQMRAVIEEQRGNLSAASDYADRALSVSSEVKDAFLVWSAYDTRASIYNDRANQCNYKRDFALCKQAFDLGVDDIRKAIQVAEQAGFDYLRKQSMQELSDRKPLSDLRDKGADLNDRLAKIDFYASKASQVMFWPRFARGRDEVRAAPLRGIVNLVTGRLSPYDPLTPFIEGQVEEMEGNDDGALQNYLRAVKLLESDRRKLGDTQGSGSFLSDKIEIYYAAAMQLLDRKQYPQAFDLIERSRARAMAELLASRDLSFRTPELQALFSQSVGLRAQIGKAQNNLFDAAASKKADSDEVKDLQAKVDSLQAQDRTLQLKIQQQAPKLADLGEKPPVSLESAQAAARQGNYDLLYYLVLGHGMVIWHIGGDSVHVVEVTSTSRSLMHFHAGALRASLSDPNSTFDERAATELYLYLVNPVLPYIPTNHLVIVPHEDLTNLPFQVLRNPEDGSFLGDRFQISYAPSATILAGLRRGPDFAHGRLLAMADPGITHAVAEVNAIGTLYPGRAKIVTDVLASKQSLKDSSGGYNLLHLSVHGTFDSNNPLLSHLTLRPAQGDDGSLTAAEMFGLNLPQNSLVVLSACETGRVEATHGNDVLGMVPALLFAGASTLVLSSWKVDAESTANWMETFYREAQTKPPSEAARLALVAVKKQPRFQHPFYWAPFLVTGQW